MNFFGKVLSGNTIRISKCLDLDRAQNFVGPDLGSNCLLKLSADNTCRQRVKCLACCKFGNFSENFIFMNSLKLHICNAKNSRLEYDIPVSVNSRVISPFNKGFIFMKLRTCEVS